MTFDPTGIAFTFDEVMVQNPPALPEYAEHSLVTWSVPLRGDANAGTARTRANAIAASIANRVLRMPSPFFCLDWTESGTIACQGERMD
jgi:hypothetical protein